MSTSDQQQSPDPGAGASSGSTVAAGPGLEHGFDFYGLGVRVTSPDSDAAAEVMRDWAYFADEEAEPMVRIRMFRSAPPYDSMPALDASQITPRNICFHGNGIEYIDYFGRGMAQIEKDPMRVDMWSEDPHVLREIAYLFLLSRVGQHLDQVERHRIHALGLTARDQGVLLLLPSGGGKSTMALRLLDRPGVGLLSEDTPLVDRQGRLYPFPLRIGVRVGSKPSVPEQYLQTVNRMEFGPKTLIDLDWFEGRIAESAPASAILLGVRNSGTESRIEPVPKRTLVKEIIGNLVVGIGVYQGIEFVFQSSWWEVFRQLRPALSRALAGLSLLRRASTYRFVLGQDREANVRCIETFLDERLQ
jgi:hypothetical protein